MSSFPPSQRGGATSGSRPAPAPERPAPWWPVTYPSWWMDCRCGQSWPSRSPGRPPARCGIACARRCGGTSSGRTCRRRSAAAGAGCTSSLMQPESAPSTVYAPRSSATIRPKWGSIPASRCSRRGRWRFFGPRRSTWPWRERPMIGTSCASSTILASGDCAGQSGNCSSDASTWMRLARPSRPIYGPCGSRT